MARPPAAGAPTPTPTPRPVATPPDVYISPADFLERCIEELKDSGDVNDTLTYQQAIDWATPIYQDMRDAEL